MRRRILLGWGSPHKSRLDLLVAIRDRDSVLYINVVSICHATGGGVAGKDVCTWFGSDKLRCCFEGGVKVNLRCRFVKRRGHGVYVTVKVGEDWRKSCCGLLISCAIGLKCLGNFAPRSELLGTLTSKPRSRYTSTGN